jgi:large subunit ribosomal protein L35
MPKMKSHSGTSKRVKVTGSGKIVRLRARRKAGAAFASTPITGSRKGRRRSAGTVEVSPADVKNVKRLLGK